MHFSWIKTLHITTVFNFNCIKIIQMKVMCFIGYFRYHASGQVESFVKNPTVWAPKSLHWAHSRHIVLTALAASQSVTCLREHSTGLTQNMLTSASFSQKPIKLIVGHIIRLTDRVRWRIVNECRTRGKTQRLTETENHTNQPPSLDDIIFQRK